MPWHIWRQRPGRVRQTLDGASPSSASGPPAPGDREAIAKQVLHQVADGLAVPLVAVWLRDRRGRYRSWLLAAPSQEIRELSPQGLRSLPTVRRAMGEQGLEFASCESAPDIAQVCRLANFPAQAAFLLEPLHPTDATGALLAAKRTGPWSDSDRQTLRTVLSHAANRLLVLGGSPASGASRWPRMARPLTAQGDSGASGWLGLRRTRRIRSPSEPRSDEGPPGATAPLGEGAIGMPVASFGSSASSLEHAARTPAATGEEGLPASTSSTLRSLEASTTVDRPAAQPGKAKRSVGEREKPERNTLDQADRTLAAIRLACYGLAFDRLPWGVVLTDPQDRVVAANQLAADLLHHNAIPVGVPAATLFPDPPRLSYALRSIASDPAETETAQHILFEASRLRVDLHPIRHSLAGYAGTVILLYRQTTLPASNAFRLVPELAAAIRHPLANIGRYSELLRRERLGGERAVRLVGRIEANLSRLAVLLDALMAAVESCQQESPLPTSGIDVAKMVHSSISRVQPQFAEKGAELVVAIDEPLPVGSSEPRAAATIMDILLMNAARRSPQATPVRLEVASYRSGAEAGVLVAVTDQGPPPATGTFGILELDCELDNPAMALARLLSERYGAQAWAESYPDGARFCLRLPVRRGIS